MHRNLTTHTWMHLNRHSSGKCFYILPLTHECTEIIIPRVNAPESYHSHMNVSKLVTPQVNAQTSYPSHMNAPKIITPQINAPISYPSHTWIHRNHHSSSKYTNILPLTHECTEIIIPQVNAPESYPSHMNAPIVTPQVNAPISYPSHMNAPTSSLLR